jgi:CDGSH iron-sulfur domain-containing protein 3
MPEPNIAQKGPFVLELEPKDYYGCACGKSSKQPFCDSSHKGSEFKPLKFTIADEKKYFLCGCKHSSSKPFCDGTHKKL